MHLADDGAAHICAHAHRHSHREQRVAHREQRTEDRSSQHQQRGGHDGSHILPGDALVNDALGQARDRQVGGDHAHQQQHRKNGVPLVGFDETKHTLQ
jgi:hypothetical protein